MPFIASDDVPQMALINLAVAVKDRICWFSLFVKFQDLLLILTGYLGIRNNERRDQSVCLAAESAFETLYEE